MFTKEDINTKLSKDLSKIYDKCFIEKTKFWSCIIIRIKGNTFGKINLCLYKNKSGKYMLTDGGFIFNDIVRGTLSADKIIPYINKFMITKYHISFKANRNIILFRIHNNYNSLSQGVAAFFMLLTFIVKSSKSQN